MGEFVHDSYCGLYCGACEILNLFRASEGSGKVPDWDELPGPLRENVGKAEIICRGCRSDTVFAGCAGCKVRECARARGIRACIECLDFPCQKVKDLRALVTGLREKLPHTASIFGEAETVKKLGYEAWSEAQRARWQCPWCGAPFTWYQERCGVCHRGLKEVRGY